jgi:hypothetical protein
MLSAAIYTAHQDFPKRTCKLQPSLTGFVAKFKSETIYITRVRMVTLVVLLSNALRHKLDKDSKASALMQLGRDGTN